MWATAVIWHFLVTTFKKIEQDININSVLFDPLYKNVTT